MWEQLNDNSVVAIALKNWVPPIITIVVGGVFASLLLPRWQDRYARSKALAARRLEIAESVTKNFQKYIVSWKRLITISRLESQSGLTDEQRQTKMSFVVSRNANRDALLESLAVVKLYFAAGCDEIVQSYFTWDDDRSSERLDQLPDIDAWREWEKRVLGCLHEELRR